MCKHKPYNFFIIWIIYFHSVLVLADLYYKGSHSEVFCKNNYSAPAVFCAGILKKKIFFSNVSGPRTSLKINSLASFFHWFWTQVHKSYITKHFFVQYMLLGSPFIGSKNLWIKRWLAYSCNIWRNIAWLKNLEGEIPLFEK